VNEVGHPIVDTVVMAIVAKALAVADIVPKFREVFDGLDVVSFQSFGAIAYLTGMIIPFQYRCFPGQVFRTAAALVLPIAPALGYTLTLYAAICVGVRFIKSLVYQKSICAAELLAANLTSAGRRISKGATLARTVHAILNVGRGALQFLTTVLTTNRDFLGMCLYAASTRAESLLGIFIPVAIRLFGNNRTTNLTSFHALRVRYLHRARYALIGTGSSTVFATLVIL